MAQIYGKPIYKITDVALIPLSSQADADQAIASAREHVQRHAKTQTDGEEDSDSESDDDAPSVTDSLIEEASVTPEEVKDPLTGQKGPVGRRTSVAEDVMQKKGVYGRFANKWFSKKGWSTDSRRLQGMTSEEELATKNAPKDVQSTLPKEEEDPTSPAAKSDALPAADKDVLEPVSPVEIPKALGGPKDSTTVTLLPKILRTTKMYFASGNFFFSYDYDLSRGIGQQPSNSSLPLFKQYDPLVSLHFHRCHPPPVSR